MKGVRGIFVTYLLVILLGVVYALVLAMAGR